MPPRFLICSLLALSLCANLARGQYPAGSTPPPGGSSQAPGTYNPSTGYHSSTGIAIGAAAAGVGIAYLVLRKHARGNVVGCLQPADAASTTLVSDNKKSTYTLINNDSVTLKTGERVALRGKKIRQNSGELAFEVHGLAKDYGACEQ
jgi:ABC-type oligopeptide transport system substrate-binding subunit